MVCAPQGPAAIAGGFVRIDAATLVAAWHACRRRPLGAGDFRTWLAAHEVLARRQRLPAGRSPTFRAAELARLCGVSERRARASVRRLAAAGLIEWSEAAIVFPPLPRPDGPWDRAIGGGDGPLTIPRRLLRFLCAGAPAAVIAVALSALLRCLSRRRSGWDGRGRFKASWVAAAFAISLRQAKAARKALVALGWLAPEPTPQWSENRWGRAFRIDLAWEPPGSRPAPPPADPGPRVAPPVADPDPLSGRDKNQDPSPGGSGIRLDPGGESRREPDPLLPPTRMPISPVPSQPPGRSSPTPTIVPAPSPARAASLGGLPGPIAPGPASIPASPAMGGPALPPVPPSARPATLPPPRLEDIRPEDLRDVGRTLDLYAQATARGVADPSEAGRLRFVALAEHARAVGTANPGGLFAALLKRGAWSFITQAEEDIARRRLKVHLYGEPASISPGPMAASRPVLSDDARLVREVRTELAMAGHRIDPFYAMRGADPAWTRPRYEAAMAELGL